MAEIIRMPRMSDTMEEGNIVGWQVSEGDQVESGDTLAEIETDKATMDFDSPIDGTILHIEIKEGPVPIGGIIAVIGEEGEDWKAQMAEATNGEDEQNASDDQSEGTPAKVEETTVGAVTDSSGGTDHRIKASPLAKNMAKESGIDLQMVQGTGDHGRIVKKDIEAFLKTKQTTKSEPTPQVTPAIPPTPAPTPTETPKMEDKAPDVQPFIMSGGAPNFTETRVSQMRKVIARRLGESKFSAPHFYLTIEINMDKSMQMRKKINEVAPVKISFNDFVIKAASFALRKHPMVNASWQENVIRMNQDVNIGVAVAVDEGLLVPVIRYADMKTLSQINTEVKTAAGKAKARKLQPEEMQGNTFTISNLGMFGIEEFTAIINPPDSCILAVGAIMNKPIVKDGAIVPGNMMKVTLSCDHRVVDGATGAKFLNSFKEILEDPIRLMV